MNVYLVLALLTLPGQQAAAQELGREWITASSASLCQAHADKFAEKHRAANAATVQRLQAQVAGRCVLQGPLT